jgi:exosortase/archaeosortase family protein
MASVQIGTPGLSAAAVPNTPLPREQGAGMGWQLAGALALLAVEIGALTPFVEVPDGVPLAHVASGRVCAGLLLGLVAFLFLSGAELRQALRPGTAPAGRRRGWLAVNLVLYAAFCLFTVRIADGGAGAAAGLVAGLWTLLAGAVGGSAFLAFLPARALGRWVAQSGGKAVLALGLGGVFALAIPWAQGLWPRLHGPMVALDAVLLRWTYGDSATATTDQGWPVIGTRKLLVLVTPQCSELESPAALWLLAGTVLLARRRQLRPRKAVGLLVAATAGVYVLLALRLYALVVAGIQVSPATCVSLAHSRIGGLFFLAVAAGVTAACQRWCRRGDCLAAL